MAVKEKPFDYVKWLAGLKAGDEVKSSGKIRTVIGVTDENIIVQFPESVGHFCRTSGREIGNKNGTYKDKTITPYTEADKKAAKLAEEKAKQEKETEDLLTELTQLALGNRYYCSTVREMSNRFSNDEIKQMIKFLKKLKSV